MANASGGTITWVLDVDRSSFDRDIDRSSESARNLSKDLDKVSSKIGADFRKSTDSASKSIGNFRTSIVSTGIFIRNLQVAFRGFRTTALIGAVLLATAALVEFIGAAVQAGNVLLVLPGILATVAAAVATIRIATVGLKDAFKALKDEDPEKLAEALQKLSPAAREFVLATKDFKDAFRPVQQAVQEAFFIDLGKQMRTLGTSFIPVLRKGLVDVSDSMNNLIIKAVQAANTDFFKGVVASTLTTTARSTDKLSSAVAPLIDLLGRLVLVALPYVERLVDWTVKQIKLGSAFLKSARGLQSFKDRIDSGLSAVGQIAGLIGALGKSVTLLFKASDASGQTFIQTLTETINKFNDFASSVEGKEKLSNTFELLNEILNKTLDLLGKIANIFLNVTKAIAGLPEPIRGVVTSFIALGIVFTPIITFLGTLLGSFFALGKALKIFSPILGIVRVALFAIVGVVAGLSATVLIFIAAIVAVIGAGVLLYKNWDVVKAKALQLGQAVIAAFLGIWNFVKPILNLIKNIIIVTFGGILLVVLTVLQTIKRVVMAVWPAISSFIAGVVKRIWTVVVNTFNTIRSAVLSILTGLRNGVVERFSIVANFFSGIRNKILGFFKKAGSWLYDVGKNIIQGIVNGIKDNIAKVQQAADGIGNAVKDKVKNLLGIDSPSKVFAGYGRNVVEGFVKGIKGSENMMSNTLGNLVDGFSGSMTLSPNITSELAGVGASSGAVINPTYNVYNNIDMEQGLRDLSWRLQN